MSRVERKKTERIKKKISGKKFICVLFVFFILMNGILMVDDSFRMMMMIEEPKVFGYKKLNNQVHEICFCGEKFYVDEQKIIHVYQSIKSEVEIFIEILKEKKNVICKYW
ncbi:hypothetical protein [Crassaminicella indica]|uniref:Uncharacterized protein n=1 Tax=Crassaminicella indica TaxID=2855394 RepID=A0ABX8RAX2_9CLOT|nr:hypothetical protein [Crassaminicella indica]QXM06209.1 hypothetical protein KVH43_12820 [Crassaminicella indica]